MLDESLSRARSQGASPQGASPQGASRRAIPTLMIAVALAISVAIGGTLGAATVSLIRNGLHAAFGGNDAVIAEQQRQAAAIARLATTLSLLQKEVDALAAEVSADEFSGGTEPGHLAAAPHEIDLTDLRRSIDATEERSRNALSAVNKRVDWLENLVYRDTTGTIEPASPARHGVKSKSGWILLHAEDGVAVITSKNGTLDVTPGYEIPNFGKVEEIRERDGRWEVVTDMGTITGP
jgi:hypothetical protein